MRTVLLSPDPRPHNRFEVTLEIKGKDSAGIPFATLGDEFEMKVLSPGSIIFERHSVSITAIDEKDDHCARLVFTSRDGFADYGYFRLAMANVDNPTIREEFTVKVTAPIAEASKPTIVLTLPRPVTKPRAPTIAVVPPKTTRIRLSAPIVAETPKKEAAIVKPVAKEIDPPVITPKEPPKEKVTEPKEPTLPKHFESTPFSHPLTWVGVLIALSLFAYGAHKATQGGLKPTIQPSTQIVGTNIPDTTTEAEKPATDTATAIVEPSANPVPVQAPVPASTPAPVAVAEPVPVPVPIPVAFDPAPSLPAPIPAPAQALPTAVANNPTTQPSEPPPPKANRAWTIRF